MNKRADGEKIPSNDDSYEIIVAKLKNSEGEKTIVIVKKKKRTPEKLPEEDILMKEEVKEETGGDDDNDDVFVESETIRHENTPNTKKKKSPIQTSTPAASGRKKIVRNIFPESSESNSEPSPSTSKQDGANANTRETDQQQKTKVARFLAEERRKQGEGVVIQHRRMEKKAKQHQEKEKTVRKSPSPLSDESLVVIDQSLMRLALKRCEDQYNKMRRNHSKLCSATDRVKVMFLIHQKRMLS